MKKFRLLKPDEIEVRISQCDERGVNLLLYKTARTDADLLDETVGTDNWENDFKLVDGVLYGGIGVNYGKGLVWKWDAGTESNTEAEKGRASDAFKRAGFKHGIGRELYSSPRIKIPAEQCKTLKKNDKGKWQCFDSFDVLDIAYDEQERIKSLVIGKFGKEAFRYPAQRTSSNTAQKAAQSPQDAPAVPIPPTVQNKLLCDVCGNEIFDSIKSDGTQWKAPDIAHYTHLRYKRRMCVSCLAAAQKREKEAEKAPESKPNNLLCTDCGKDIRSVKKKDGAMWGVVDMVAFSERQYGRRLCGACMKKAAESK